MVYRTGALERLVRVGPIRVAGWGGPGISEGSAVRFVSARVYVERQEHLLGGPGHDSDRFLDSGAGYYGETSEAAQQAVDGNLDLQSGELLAEAPVDSHAEGNVRVPPPIEPEFVRMLELRLVAVADCQCTASRSPS